MRPLHVQPHVTLKLELDGLDLNYTQLLTVLSHFLSASWPALLRRCISLRITSEKKPVLVVVDECDLTSICSRTLVSHTYTNRPLSASQLLLLFLAHPAPRPSLIYLPNTNPSTLVFSVNHANLLFLLTTSSDIEPLVALEFIHRVIDNLEEFLGQPLLAAKIESSYDVVAQLLNEMCDAGTIATTEGNALRDLVEVEGFMGKLLGGLNLSGYSTLPSTISSFAD